MCDGYFSRYSKVFTSGISFSWWILFAPSGTHLCEAYFSRYTKVYFLWNPSSLENSLQVQVWHPFIKCGFQDISRLLYRECKNVGEFSLFEAGCIWFKRTFQDRARYSTRILSHGECSGFQVWHVCMGPTSQNISRFLLRESQILDEFSQYKRYRMVFMHRISVFGEFSVFQAWLACFMHTFKYSKVFMHGISVSWRILFNTSGTSLDQGCFSRCSKILYMDSQDIGESSLIKAGCAWIKRTFQDIAMYSRIIY